MAQPVRLVCHLLSCSDPGCAGGALRPPVCLLLPSRLSVSCPALLALWGSNTPKCMHKAPRWMHAANSSHLVEVDHRAAWPGEKGGGRWG